MPDFSYELKAKEKGYKLVCGVDEAGRGPLAGPVCAAAVILPEGLEIEGLNDSKKLTEAKREKLFDIIIEKAISYSVAFGTVEEIEEHNILNATFIAMNKAIACLRRNNDDGISRKITGIEKAKRTHSRRTCKCTFCIKNGDFKVGIRQRIPEHRFFERNIKIFRNNHRRAAVK